MYIATKLKVIYKKMVKPKDITLSESEMRIVIKTTEHFIIELAKTTDFPKEFKEYFALEIQVLERMMIEATGNDRFDRFMVRLDKVLKKS